MLSRLNDSSEDALLGGRKSRWATRLLRGLAWSAATIAACLWVVVAARAVDSPDTPGSTDPAGAPPAAEGTTPYHIIPRFLTQVGSLSPGGDHFQANVPGSFRDPGRTVSVLVPGYAQVHQISLMAMDALRRGDSVAVQGQADTETSTFTARRIIRTAKKIGLAPGIELAPARGGSDGADSEAHPVSDVFGSLGAVLNGETSSVRQTPSPAAVRPGGKAATALKAEKFISQGIRQGRAAGLVVSNSPLVIELYDGQLWTVQSQPNTMVIDQVRIPHDQLKNGALVQVVGSEVGPNTFRASEINLVPPGIARQFAGAGGGGRGRGFQPGAGRRGGRGRVPLF